jgi:pimeloyl-ACP methyl ester carboxylesterase
MPIDFAEPKTAHTNGIAMEYFEQGAGPAVLLLHGFPEHPFSWRKQVDPIAQAGFRVIVPCQRGYAGTDAPVDIATYSVKNLVADLSGLLDALGIERAAWVGHDWGSVPAWYSGVYAPARVAALGSLCTPYVRWSRPRGVVDAGPSRHGPNHYMRTFQHPGVAEATLGRDVEHTFRSLLRARGYTMDEFEAAPSAVRELPIGVLVGDPQLLGRPIVSEEELRFYIDVYERSGFTGGLNWYRAYRTNIQDSRCVNYEIDKPALMITAADDWFWPRDSTSGMTDLLPQLEAHTVPKAAHWLHQEKPDEVNAILVPWLERAWGEAGPAGPAATVNAEGPGRARGRPVGPGCRGRSALPANVQPARSA